MYFKYTFNALHRILYCSSQASALEWGYHAKSDHGPSKVCGFCNSNFLNLPPHSRPHPGRKNDLWLSHVVTCYHSHENGCQPDSGLQVSSTSGGGAVLCGHRLRVRPGFCIRVWTRRVQLSSHERRCIIQKKITVHSASSHCAQNASSVTQYAIVVCEDYNQ